MERPNKCYIRQEWFEAVSWMSKEERCTFYEALMSFVYYGEPRDTPPPSVRGVYEMAKPTLQNDILKYGATCVKNRQNGSNGGRKPRGLTQKNPTEPTETQTPPNIHIQLQETKNYTNSLFPKEEMEREKVVFIELFSRGAAHPIEETHRLMDYYAARGWVDKGGNPIVDLAAIARVWRMEDFSPYFANVRKKWSEFLRGLPPDMPHGLASDFVRMEIPTNNPKNYAYIYHRGGELPQLIENTYLHQLRAAIILWGVSGVEYRQMV